MGAKAEAASRAEKPTQARRGLMPLILAGNLPSARALWSNRCDWALAGFLGPRASRPLLGLSLTKKERAGRPRSQEASEGRSALARFETALGLVDDIDPALAPDDAIVAVAAPQRFQ